MVVPVSVLLSRIRRGLEKLRSNPYEWLVLVGDRLVVAGTLTFFFALGVLGLQRSGLVTVTDTTQMIYVFQGLIAGNLTLVTIVLSINQLVLAREFNAPGELEDRIESVIDYRSRVERTVGRPTVPVTPAKFLSVVLDGARTNAQKLGGAVEHVENDELAADVDALVSALTAHTDHISQVLEDSQKGTFSALAVTLETNYSEQLNEAYRIQTVYEDELPAAAHELLDELTASLKQIDIARQYFKSIYMQSELARLSRILLYVGVPAIASGIFLILIYASTVDPPLTLMYLNTLVAAVVILGFTPLAVLFSFLLRIAMVAQRTVAITPFTTPSQEREFAPSEQEWDPVPSEKGLDLTPSEEGPDLAPSERERDRAPSERE